MAVSGCADAPGASGDPARPDLSRLLQFKWSTNQTLGPSVLALDYALAEAATCNVNGLVATRATVPGLTSLVIGLDSRNQVLFAAPTQESAPVSAGANGVASQGRTEQFYEGGGGGAGGRFEPGTYTLLLAAPDVQPGPAGGALAGDSVVLDIACDKPFAVLGARFGHDVALASEESLDSQGRLDAGATFGAALNGTLRLDTDAPLAIAVFNDFGGVARDVRLEHPSGTARWGPADPIFPVPVVVDGPGHYAFDVTRTGSGRFWAAILALDSSLDLARGRLDLVHP